MKKVLSILVVLVGFAFNANAQEVKTVALEQTKGEFTQKQITLEAGTYVFGGSSSCCCIFLFVLHKDEEEEELHYFCFGQQQHQ